MFQKSLALVATLLMPQFLAQFANAQDPNSCPNKVNYVGVRNPDGGTKVMVNYRSPVDNSAVTQAQMDKVLIGLKMKGDGNAMKGRNKELGTQASQL